MTDFKAAKVVAAVPTPPEPDTVYFVKTGAGFDLYATNGVGEISAYKLNESGEWSESIVPQAEAEDGTATTARKWTAQRVRQGINAWWMGVTSTLGRTLVGRTTTAEMRGDLELGTAATRNVGTDSGNVMEVGAFGLGGVRGHDRVYPVATTQTGFSTFMGSTDPALPQYGMSVVFGSRATPDIASHDNWLGQLYSDTFSPPTLRFRSSINGSGWGQPVILHHTGNILSSTGSSTSFPMTQKAVTDAINARGFEDASGVLTVTSGALSNAVGSFLSQPTRAAMRADLAVPQLNAGAFAQGGLKARLSGTTLYLSNDGTNP